MVEDRIGYRYAKSAFEIAQEKGILEEVNSDMGLFLEVCAENRDFVNLLDSPIIKGDKKQAVIDAIFGSLFQSELMKLLVAMVVRKGREKYMPNVAQSFSSMYDEAKGIGRGTIVSAVELSDTEVQNIQSTLEKTTGKSFELNEEVDPSLIGGFVLKVGDTLFDGSVSSVLRRVKQSLV